MNRIHTARIDLNLLEVFEAVAKTRSTTLAADRLAISQSAVSHALNRLRDIVGDPLFVRGRAGLVPTPHATSMIGPAGDLLGSARSLLEPAHFEPAASTRRFKVGASDYGMLTTVPGLVRSVRTKAPKVSMEVIAIGEQVLAQLEAGDLDIAFYGGKPPTAPFLSLELFREHFVGIICALHPLAIKTGQGALSLDDYLEYPHAMVTFRDPQLSPIDAALALVARSRHIAFVTPNFASNVASLPGTDLIMSIPARLADNAVRPDLVQFDLPLIVPDYAYSVIWHRRMVGDPAFVWLMQQVVSRSEQT